MTAIALIFVIITERKQERHVDRAQRVETTQIAPACPFDLSCLHLLRSVDMTFSRSVPPNGIAIAVISFFDKRSLIVLLYVNRS
jgi:hypothetical protein